MSRVLIWSITATTLGAKGNYTTFAMGESYASSTATAMICESNISGYAGIAAGHMNSCLARTARYRCETEGKRRSRRHSRKDDQRRC